MPEETPKNIIEGPENKVPKKGNEGAGAKEDIKMCRELMDIGVAAKAPFSNDWKLRMDMYRDAREGDRNPPRARKGAYRAAPVLNIIRSTIQSILPILTDASPGFNVLPGEPTDFAFAQILNEAVSSWWKKYSMDHSMVEVLTDQSVYDAGIIKITWDEELEDGAGDIRAEVVDPADIFIDPAAADFTRSCSWVIHRTRKTVGMLKIEFPKFADLITPEDSPKDKDDVSAGKSMDIQLVSPVDKDVGIFNQQPTSGSDLRKTCEVWECWITDDEVEEYYEENDEEHKNRKFKKKFPRGKLLTILPNKKLRLQSVESPYKHGRFPFVRFIDTILPRSFWGEGEVRSLMGMQAIINKLLGNVLDYTNMMANPVWITEDGNGVDPNRLTNQIGLVIRVKAGKAGTIKRDVVPAMQSGALELLSWMLRQVEMISGSAEVSQGRRPTGITAASAIESLQEAANTRIRLKERNMNVSLGQLGYLVTSLMMQFYDTPRVVRVTGKGEREWPDYFDFFIEDTPEGLKSTKRKYVYQDGQGYTMTGAETTPPSKGVFDVKVASGTNLPFQKAQRSNIAFRLHEAQAIDVEELLKALDWPNQEMVLNRMQQAAAAVPPPPPPPMGG